MAQQVLALQPPATPAQRRTAWTVLAHTAFERAEFDQAERAYVEVLALLPAQDAARNDMVERLAASVYKQGERARDAGQARDAVAHFARVATVAPQSAVRATAQYDAAAALIGLKDWDGAARTLEDFRQRYPKHALQAEVGNKLTRGLPGAAALGAGRRRVGAGGRQPARTHRLRARVAVAGGRAVRQGRLARRGRQGLRPVRDALPATAGAGHRGPLAHGRHRQGRRAAGARARVDAGHLPGRPGRRRRAQPRAPATWAAWPSLALAAPVFEAYRKVELVEPLARQLKLKKARLEDVLKAYAVAADYGVAEVSTAATFQVASLYQDFGRALMNSQRPKKLSKKELEQYDLMLEEQAFPFEEKAIELHELNARRAREGVYDDWVKRSFAALRELKPVRYAKNERVEGAIDAIR